jgi:hypothetical protein
VIGPKRTLVVTVMRVGKKDGVVVVVVVLVDGMMMAECLGDGMMPDVIAPNPWIQCVGNGLDPMKN